MAKVARQRANLRIGENGALATSEFGQYGSKGMKKCITSGALTNGNYI